MYCGHGESEILVPESIEGMVVQYNILVNQITEAHVLTEKAEENAKQFGVYIQGGRNSSHITFDLKDALSFLKVDSWKMLTEKTKTNSFASEKRVKDFNDQMKNRDVPDFTVENINAFLENLKNSLPQIFVESVNEVFNWLRPWNCEKYKTNEKNAKFELGEKIIIESAMDSYGFRGFSSYRENMFRNLDNIFHIMDKQPTAIYPKDIKTLVSIAGKDGNLLETDYFSMKWFKNRNMHVKFKRMDLVEKLNAIAGGNNLKM
jgi:hypothetical protein